LLNQFIFEQRYAQKRSEAGGESELTLTVIVGHRS